MQGVVYKLRLQEEVGRQSKNVNLIRQKLSTKGGRWSKKPKNLSTQFVNSPQQYAHKTPILLTSINLFVLSTSDTFEIDICRSLTNQTLLFLLLIPIHSTYIGGYQKAIRKYMMKKLLYLQITSTKLRSVFFVSSEGDLSMHINSQMYSIVSTA